VLCGSAHWAGLVRWVQARMMEEGLIGRSDMDLIQLSDSPDEIVELAVGAEPA
jgi:predicted Rossmann-fold nucleotide-binding protein